MRILLVSHSSKDPNAGASRVYHLLAQGLIDRGHFVTTLHLEDFQISRVAMKTAVRLFLPQVASRRTMREDPLTYDVIMSSNGMLYPLFRSFQRKAARPLLVNHLHGLSFFDYQAIVTERMRGHVRQSLTNKFLTGPLPSRWDDLGCRGADLTIVQNQRDLDFLSGRGIGNVISIHLSTHPEISEAGMSAPPNESRNPNNLLWFGSWTERKGIHYVPRAFRLICDKNPNARLTIGGTGLSEDTIKAAFDPSLRPLVSVLPHVSTTEQVRQFSRHSIFLFPSISEGFGYALLEAMSMGLASVTTPTGLGGDLLADGENCRMIPSASAIHLANATLELMQNNQRRSRIATNGQSLSRSFTTSRFLDHYESTFLSHTSRP